MIKRLLLGTIVLGLAGLTNLSAAPVTLNFSSGPGSMISFNGSGDFGFTTTGGYDFSVTGGTNAAGTLGDTGNILPNANNVFVIGTPSGISAPVTGSGAFSLNDGGGTAPNDYLTGTVTFGNIYEVGSGGGLNDYTTSINLTGLAYTGTNAALTQLAAGSGIVTVGYSFTASETLAALKTSAISTSYAGTITSATPEPSLSGLALLGFGVLLMTMWRRFQASKT